jgi:hypothetical protein
VNDGYRIQLRITDGGAELRTRSGLDWSSKFRSIPGLSRSNVSSTCLRSTSRIGVRGPRRYGIRCRADESANTATKEGGLNEESLRRAQCAQIETGDSVDAPSWWLKLNSVDGRVISCFGTPHTRVFGRISLQGRFRPRPRLESNPRSHDLRRSHPPLSSAGAKVPW